MKEVNNKNEKDLPAVNNSQRAPYIPLIEPVWFPCLTYIASTCHVLLLPLPKVFHQLGYMEPQHRCRQQKQQTLVLESEGFLKAFIVCLVPRLLSLG